MVFALLITATIIVVSLVAWGIDSIDNIRLLAYIIILLYAHEIDTMIYLSDIEEIKKLVKEKKSKEGD